MRLGEEVGGRGSGRPVGCDEGGEKVERGDSGVFNCDGFGVGEEGGEEGGVFAVVEEGEEAGEGGFGCGSGGGGGEGGGLREGEFFLGGVSFLK